MTRGVSALLTFSSCDGIFKSGESTKKQLTTVLVDDIKQLNRLYDEGNKAFEEQNYTEATQKFAQIEKTISIEENNFQKIQLLCQALNMLGNIKTLLGHSQEAIYYFDQIYSSQKRHNILLGGTNTTQTTNSVYLSGIETIVRTQLNSVAGNIALQNIDFAEQNLSKAEELIKIYESHASSPVDKKTAHKLRAYYNNNLADFALKQGNLNIADISFRDAFDQCEEIKDEEGKLLAQFYLFYVHYLVFKKDVPAEKRTWYFDNMKTIVFSLKQYYGGELPFYTKELLRCFDSLLEGFDNADMWKWVSDTKTIISNEREKEFSDTSQELLNAKDEKFKAKTAENEANQRALEARHKELEALNTNRNLIIAVWLLSLALLGIGGRALYLNLKKKNKQLESDNNDLIKEASILSWKSDNLKAFNQLMSHFTSHSYEHLVSQLNGIFTLYTLCYSDEYKSNPLNEYLEQCFSILKNQNHRIKEIKKIEEILDRIILFKKEQFDNLAFFVKRYANKIRRSLRSEDKNQEYSLTGDDIQIFEFYGHLDIIANTVKKISCHLSSLLTEGKFSSKEGNVNISLNFDGKQNLLITFTILGFSSEDLNNISSICETFNSDLSLSALMDKRIGNYDHIFQGKMFDAVLYMTLYGSRVELSRDDKDKKIFLNFIFPNLKELS